MSMWNENLHDVLDTLSLIESTSLVYWQKYVQGSNLTYFDCPSMECIPRVQPNVVRLLGHVKHTEFVHIPDQEDCYYSSLIMPIFQQLSRRVNISFEFYVSRTANQNVYQVDSISRGLSTAADRVPFIYTYDSSFSGVACAPPLYLINQLQILTAKSEVQSSVEDIFKVFSWSIWSIIFLFYLACVSLELVSNRKSIDLSLVWSSFVNYFTALLEKEAPSRPRNRWLFMFWVLGCIPLVEIFRNDMIAKIVENKFLYVDSIENLLNTKLQPMATGGDMTLWTSDRFILYDQIEFESVKQNYRLLLNRTETLSFTDSKWFDALASPRQMIQLFRSSAILEDEFAIKFFEKVLGEFIPTHLSRESYLPQYVTPICYNENFTYAYELQKLSRELFEKGFLAHWDHLKQSYYGTFGKRLFRLLAGDDVLDRVHWELSQASQSLTMANLFEYFLTVYLVLVLINCSVFVLELLYYFVHNRYNCWQNEEQVFALNGQINDRVCQARHIPHSSLSY